MKKLVLLSLISAIFILNTCNLNVNNKATVIINLQDGGTKSIAFNRAISKAPEGVDSIVLSLYVDSIDAENRIYTNTYSANATTITLTLEPGENRIIVIEARDADQNVLYSGTSEPFDIDTGHVTQLTIIMEPGGVIYIVGNVSTAIHQAWVWNSSSQEITYLYEDIVCFAWDVTALNGEVFIAGEYYDGSRLQACFWQGSGTTYSQTDLPIPAGVYSEAIGITTAGNNVYFAGWQGAMPPRIGCHWIYDGTSPIRTDYTDPPAATDMDIKAVAVFGTDVYSVGQNNHTGPLQACYWVNGIATDLDIPPVVTTTSICSDIAITSGGDVYISGQHQNGGYFPCYWLNGTRVDLASDGDGKATCILVDETADPDNLYVGGYDGTSGDHRAVFWENGVKHMLNESETSRCSELFIVNGILHAVGNRDAGEGNRPTHWYETAEDTFTEEILGSFEDSATAWSIFAY